MTLSTHQPGIVSSRKKFLLALIGFVGTWAIAFGTPVAFDIPAEPAPAAIRQFIR
jgi:hypothetical protein